MPAHRLPYDWGKAPFKVLDPGDTYTIKLDRQIAYVPLVSAAAETRTLPRPTRVNQLCVLGMTTYVGTITVTVTGGYDETGGTTLAFSAAGQYVMLVGVNDSTTTFVWRVVGYDGVVGPTTTLASLTATTAAITTATVTTLTPTTLNSPAVATSHGVGAIGTAVAPATSRRTENGVIITDTKIDLTGLASKNTADDIIGLAAGGAAYIGRNVVSANGVIFKAELICLEVPAGGDTDVNVVAGSAATDVYDAAVTGAAVIINGGVQAAGIVTQNLVPAIAANYYYYLTTGAGSTAGTYTGGMFIFRTYGHALLA